MWYDECLSIHFSRTRNLSADMEDEQTVANEDFDFETLRLISSPSHFPVNGRDFSHEE